MKDRRIAEHGLFLIGLACDDDPAGALLLELRRLPDGSRIWAMGQLVALGDNRAIGPLYHIASDVRASQDVRICAAAALATFGSGAVSEIRSLMGQADALGRALGGLAAVQVEDPSLGSALAHLCSAAADGFVKTCIALANGKKVDG